MSKFASGIAGKTRKKRRIGPLTVILIIILIAGIGVMLYPYISNAWNTRVQKQLVAEYQEEVRERIANGETSYEYEREKARAYNNELWPTSDPEAFIFLNEDDPEPEYLECLNINGDGIMGYISIPKIDVEIPIYHATDDEDMMIGAGHLEGTSLPIGGESTHSVIAAHRGLPSAALFTNLDKLEIGDHFTLHILDEYLCYEVDDINVVLPDEVGDLVIREGEDLCTLVTCTPYGVNTHRLLVTGHRVGYDETYESEETVFEMTTQNWLLLIAVLVACGAILYVSISERRSKKKISNSP